MDLLGTPDVAHAGKVLVLPSRKALALLVYLAVEGGLHSREKLAALFWPEADQVHARAALRYTLSCLRHALGDGATRPHLTVAGDVLGLNAGSPADLEVDLNSFQAASSLARAAAGDKAAAAETLRVQVATLGHAADPWRGDFLAGFCVRDAPDFDEWVGVQREIWHRRLEDVLDRQSELQAELGNTTAALETAARWRALSPLDERACRRLMQLHLARGNPSAALRTYEACRDVLHQELHTRPAAETEALAERIRAAGMEHTTSPSHAHAPASTPARLEGPLVGRSNEFVNLVELYTHARNGRAGVAVVEGEAGIGKTLLTTEFLGWAAAQGADVLQGRAFETGGRLPYQPLVDAMRPRVERENAPDDLLSDVWLAELARLLPEPRDRYPDLPVPTGDEALARTRLFEAVVRLGQALANRRAPIVVLVDDLQWADVASLDVLRYAARHWSELGVPALLLLGVRSDAVDADPALGEWLLDLERDVPVRRLTLGPITRDDTEQLVHGLAISADGSEPDAVAATPSTDFAGWLFAETGGHPFFVIETLKALFERDVLVPRSGESAGWTLRINSDRMQAVGRHDFLPTGVRQIVQARLARLSPSARTLLTAAAVLGPSATFERLCRVAGLTENEALTDLDDVLRAHFLREVESDDNARMPGAYLFVHDKIRDAVHAQAGEARRRVFHRRALEVLHAGTPPAAELAHHALDAGLAEPAVHFSLAAGDDAMRLLAARDALAHYGRALPLAEGLGRPDLVMDLRARRGHAFASIELWAEAKAELEAALAGLPADQPGRRAGVLVDLALACFWLLDLAGVERHATEALSLAEAAERGDLAASAIALLAVRVQAGEGDLGAASLGQQRALERAAALGIPPPTLALQTLSITHYWLGRLDQAVESSRDAIRVAREASDASMMMYGLPHLGLSLAASGQYAEALDVFAEARRFGHEYAMDKLVARAVSMSAGWHLDVFDFAGAEALAMEARDRALALDFPPPAVSAGIDLLLSYARSQEVGRAEQLVESVAASLAQAAGWHGWLWRLRLAEARAEMAVARGAWEEVVHWADQAIAQSRAKGRVKYEAIGLGTRAQALYGLGRTTAALADFSAAVALARSIGDPALFLRAATALLAVDGDEALAVEAARAAARIASALPDGPMRQRFETAEHVQGLARWAATAF